MARFLSCCLFVLSYPLRYVVLVGGVFLGWVAPWLVPLVAFACLGQSLRCSSWWPLLFALAFGCVAIPLSWAVRKAMETLDSAWCDFRRNHESLDRFLALGEFRDRPHSSKINLRREAAQGCCALFATLFLPFGLCFLVKLFAWIFD